MATQTTNERSPVPKWFWILGIIAVLWNLMGLLAYVAQMMMVNSDEMLAALPVEQQGIYKSMPTWVTICFTIAVVFGVVGSVLLLMRNKLAVPVLIFSLISVLGQYGYMFFMSNTPAVMGAGAMVLPGIVVFISIALVPYAFFCKQRGLLN
ncbi:MAG: hypothetical protein R3C53_09265 [Pirellulaceae bacterium]